MSTRKTIRNRIAELLLDSQKCDCQRSVVHGAADLSGVYQEVGAAYYSFVAALKKLEEFDLGAEELLEALGEETK